LLERIAEIIARLPALLVARFGTGKCPRHSAPGILDGLVMDDPVLTISIFHVPDLKGDRVQKGPVFIGA
jgi:hypothetical protein